MTLAFIFGPAILRCSMRSFCEWHLLDWDPDAFLAGSHCAGLQRVVEGGREKTDHTEGCFLGLVVFDICLKVKLLRFGLFLPGLALFSRISDLNDLGVPAPSKDVFFCLSVCLTVCLFVCLFTPHWALCYQLCWQCFRAAQYFQVSVCWSESLSPSFCQLKPCGQNDRSKYSDLLFVSNYSCSESHLCPISVKSFLSTVTQCGIRHHDSLCKTVEQKKKGNINFGV